MIWRRRRCCRTLADWREPVHGLRIAVDHWQPLCRVDDQFIDPPRSLRLVWHYLKRIGLIAVLRKIHSRLCETARNRKVAAVGTGMILEFPENSPWQFGERVLFFAPNHPEERRPTVCVDERFVFRVADFLSMRRTEAPGNDLPQELVDYVGWSVFSGVDVDRERILQGLTHLIGLFPTFGERNASFDVAAVEVTERIEATHPRRAGRPLAVLFGLGHYAKTQIIPHIRQYLDLRCVHELDPDQLRTAYRWGVALDTSPVPREDERYDAWFIAGYHHTHAELAVHALHQGAYAVVEKPLATTWRQYESLRRALGSAGSRRLFACFHKRYSKLNEWALHDLEVNAGDPVDMHCIVYEIPLPRRHWYNWPNSGSRLVSNGCHWLDYFLFINGYCPVVEAGLWLGRGGDLVVFARLENSAILSLSLTDTGSARLGVRDLIELRAGDVTVRMIDGTFYEAESSVRVLRRKRVNPMPAYRRMYESICCRIAEGGHGDEFNTLRSTELMLRLEDEVRTKRG